MSNRKRSHAFRSQAARSPNQSVGFSEKDELQQSNIANVIPYCGMKLEIRDADYIWSSGFIVKVESSKGEHRVMVTVASDGWGREWDEVMEWPNDRLARLYTYTKHVKCNLDLIRRPVRNKKPSRQELEKLPKNAKRGFSTMWPVSVQFRMPHPGVVHARDTLRLEDKTFVKPYGVKFLPREIQHLMIHDGGCWLHHSRLRKWKDDPDTLGVLPQNYLRAFKIAQQDKLVKGFLLVQALEDNSLLQEIYRIDDIRGCELFDGVLRETKHIDKRQRLDNLDEDENASETGSEKLPSVVVIHGVVDTMKQSEYSEPPTLPPPIPLAEALHPNSGVTKCKMTNEWVASLSMNGNQVLLGSFPTESQAWLATRKAKGECVELPKTLLEAQQADLQAVSMETIIDTYDAQYDPSIHSFSLHNWTVAKINHYCYMREKMRAENEARHQRQHHVRPQQGDEQRQSKRKGQPTKLASHIVHR